MEHAQKGVIVMKEIKADDFKNMENWEKVACLIDALISKQEEIEELKMRIIELEEGAKR